MMKYKRKDKKGIILTTAGVILVSLSVLLFVFQTRRISSADKTMSAVNESILKAMPEKRTASIDPGKECNEDFPMLLLQVEGESYIGIVEIPALSLTLPVLWGGNGENKGMFPYRYSGCDDSGTLIIAGSNDRKRFGKIMYLQSGEHVYFTNVKGEVLSLVISDSQTLEKDTEIPNGFDNSHLTLITSTLSGQKKIAVHCVLEQFTVSANETTT